MHYGLITVGARCFLVVLIGAPHLRTGVGVVALGLENYPRLYRGGGLASERAGGWVLKVQRFRKGRGAGDSFLFWRGLKSVNSAFSRSRCPLYGIR